MRLAMDSSAAAKRYIDESRSVDVRNLLGAGHVVLVNRLVAVEVASALARRMRDGSLTEAQVRIGLRALNFHVRRRYQLVEFSAEVQKEASRVVVANQVRASDAVHVATALIILRDAPDVAFLTADRRQANAATAEGLTVIFVGD